MTQNSTVRAAVCVRNLTYSPAGHALFRGLNLIVAPGESVAIVGVSGSGKTTLLELLLANQERSYSGQVRFDNERAALVLQDGALLDHLNVLDNLRLVSVYEKLGHSDEDLLSYLAQLNLPGDFAQRRVHTLSGGEKRRVAIARALVRNPDVLCFDEPDAGLDPANRRDLALALRQLNEKDGKTIIVATHDSLLTSLVADKVYFLNDGLLKLVFDWSDSSQNVSNESTRREQIERLYESQSDDESAGRSHSTHIETSIVPELLKGAVATIASVFKWNPSWLHYARIAGRSILSAFVTGIVFYFLVGAMLGATTIVVIKNVTEHAISGLLALVIKPDFVLQQLNGMYIAYFAPAIGGILFIARSGSIMTSWLGALSFGKQLQALGSLGVNPNLYLSSPIFLSLVVSYILTVFVFGVGMWIGSFITAEYLYDISGAARMLLVTPDMVTFANVQYKTVLYGVVSGLMICTLGMARKPHVDAVARHTTLVIILSTVLIAISELGFSVIS